MDKSDTRMVQNGKKWTEVTLKWSEMAQKWFKMGPECLKMGKFGPKLS